MTNPTLGIIVGSNRRESINRKLAQGLAKLAAGRFDVKFIQIDDLPIYNQDLETAPPARSKKNRRSAPSPARPPCRGSAPSAQGTPAAAPPPP